MDAVLGSLLRAGRFADALAAIQQIAYDSPLSDELQVVRVELLERTGRTSDAQKTARRLVSNGTLTPALLARCQTLIGTIDLEAGKPHAAVRQLQDAVATAKTGHCLTELCWAELRLLAAQIEQSPSDATAGLVRDLRRHVIQAGDPVLSCALHVFASELDAKRGAIDSARRHLQVAKSLLDGLGNYWIRGIATVADFCISYLSCELELAQNFAQESLKGVAFTGHAWMRLAALTNLGHLSLQRDDLVKAEKFLKQAWTASAHSPRMQDSILEGFARLRLQTGELSRCEELLTELHARPTGEMSYPKVWSLQTKCRCLMRQLRWPESAEVAGEGIRLGRASGDRVLHSTFLLLRAEARAVLGDLAAAGTDILEATSNHDEMPLDMLGEVHRVIGRTLAREGDLRGAAAAYRRSARILHAIGHLRGQHDVEAAAADDNVSTTPDAEPGTSRPDLLLGRAMAALDQSARPDLLGAELLALARETGCSSAALISRSATDLAVNAVTGWTPADATAAANTASGPIPLGRWRERDWTLIGDVAPTVAAQTTWMAIRTLARAGTVLANARRDARESKALWPIENPDTPSPGIFISEQMIDLVRVAKKFGAVNFPVLITGETGVGKEIFAHIVHDASGRAAKPFVPYNCATVPRDLLESQLFGHRRGAFTGADHASPGVIRTAAGGTLFLDEIGELPLDLQAKLLRFIENGEIHPLGEPQPIRVDVRIVAATNRDVEQQVGQGTIRNDLFFRLKGLQLQIPPLRERREEIPRLAWHFLERFARTHQKSRLRLADDTMEYLVLYAWPGNVRELINEIQRMAALAETDAVLMPEHLSAAITGSRRTRPASELDLLPTEVVVRLDQPISAAADHLERTMVQYAMKQHGNNLELVAKALGLSRKGLYLKRRRLGLDVPD